MSTNNELIYNNSTISDLIITLTVDHNYYTNKYGNIGDPAIHIPAGLFQAKTIDDNERRRVTSDYISRVNDLLFMLGNL